jgi:hypothetical protein
MAALRPFSVEALSEQTQLYEIDYLQIGTYSSLSQQPPVIFLLKLVYKIQQTLKHLHNNF